MSKLKAMPAPMMDARDKQWRAEEDFRTLCRAEEIRADKARLKLAIAEGERKKAETEKALQRVSGLRK